MNRLRFEVDLGSLVGSDNRSTSESKDLTNKAGNRHSNPIQTLLLPLQEPLETPRGSDEEPNAMVRPNSSSSRQQIPHISKMRRRRRV
jgi:hypothetical protein